MDRINTSDIISILIAVVLILVIYQFAFDHVILVDEKAWKLLIALCAIALITPFICRLVQRIS